MAQTQKQALAAYAALIGMGRKVTGKVAFSLFKMKQQLRELIDFQAEEEQKLVEKYEGTISENGKITIPDEDNRRAFLEEKKRIGEMEIEPEIKPIRINPDDIPEINIEEIEALSGFIEFE